MKKIIAAIVLLLIIVSMAVPSASSKEYVRAADSAVINQAIKTQLEAEESDTVVRIYHMSIKDAFTEYDTVDQALLSEDLSGISYAVISEHSAVRYYENNDGIYRHTNTYAFQIPTSFYSEGNGKIWEQIGSDAIIYYRYFIHGTAQDSAVFYKTSQGDFVYYYTQKIGQHLFPLKDFISYQNAPYPLTFSNEIVGETMRLNDYFYFFYDTVPLKENYRFFLCAVVLLLIAGIITTAVIVYRKKYKVHIPSSQTQEVPFDPDLIINHCLNSTACLKQ